MQYYEGKHPCEKPLDLMAHIITASSLPGDTVLDIFSGSGSTATAYRRADRKFIGCDFGENEFFEAVRRIKL